MFSNYPYISLNCTESVDAYVPLPSGSSNRSQKDYGDPEGLDIVQFSEAIGLVQSDKGVVHIDLMRIGNYHGEVSVRYVTSDGSAINGQQYVHSEGTIIMKDGQSLAHITVGILNDPDWNASKEFKVTLSHPEGCELGKYLKMMRVKVVDSDPFPSDKFKDVVAKGEEGIEGASEWPLFFGLCELLSHQEGVMKRTVAAIAIGILKNLYEYMYLVLSIYMVDIIFNMKNDGSGLIVPGNRLLTTYAVAFLLFFPKCLFYLLDHADVSMDIAGLLRAELSKSLYRHFMCYGIESRHVVPESDMVVSLTQDVQEVTYGYMRILSSIRLLGQIGIGVFFTLQHNPSVWWAIPVVPAVMFLWAHVRTKVSIEAAQESDKTMTTITSFIHETMSKMPLISAYKMRPHINDLFALKVAAFKNVRIPEKRVAVNNNVVPKLLGPALVGGYTAYGASLVLGESLPLGTYLATIRAFGNICHDFEELYSLVMEIIATFPALKGLTVLLNMGTDLYDQEQANKARKDVTLERCESLTKSVPPTQNDPVVDKLKIEMIDATYKVPMYNKVVLEKMDFTCAQGSIVTVIARSGCGRRTLLDMMCQNVFPTSGTLYIPSHLRTLLVTREVMYFEELTVWQNLTFGCTDHCDPYRVESILRFFNISDGDGKSGHMDDVLRLVQKELDFRKGQYDLQGEQSDELNDQAEAAELQAEAENDERSRNPMDVMTDSKRALIHLCRGFIYNPEVLMVHRPFSHFHDFAIFEKVEDAFAEHRDNRGLMMLKDSSMNKRRPRTAILTPDVRGEVIRKLADIIWYLPEKPGEPCMQYDMHSGQEMPDELADKLSKVTRSTFFNKGFNGSNGKVKTTDARNGNNADILESKSTDVVLQRLKDCEDSLKEFLQSKS